MEYFKTDCIAQLVKVPYIETGFTFMEISYWIK